MRLLSFKIGKAEFYLENSNFEDSLVTLGDAFKKFFELEKFKLVDNFTVNALKRTKKWVIAPLMQHFRGDAKIKDLMKFNMNVKDAIERVAKETTFRQQRAYVGTKEIAGMIEEYKPSKFALKSIESGLKRAVTGVMILLSDRYILDGGIEKHSVFLPDYILRKKKVNLKPGDKITFTLVEIRTKAGQMVLSAEDIKKID